MSAQADAGALGQAGLAAVPNIHALVQRHAGGRAGRRLGGTSLSVEGAPPRRAPPRRQEEASVSWVAGQTFGPSGSDPEQSDWPNQPGGGEGCVGRRAKGRRQAGGVRRAHSQRMPPSRPCRTMHAAGMTPCWAAAPRLCVCKGWARRQSARSVHTQVRAAPPAVALQEGAVAGLGPKAGRCAHHWWYVRCPAGGRAVRVSHPRNAVKAGGRGWIALWYVEAVRTNAYWPRSLVVGAGAWRGDGAWSTGGRALGQPPPARWRRAYVRALALWRRAGCSAAPRRRPPPQRRALRHWRHAMYRLQLGSQGSSKLHPPRRAVRHLAAPRRHGVWGASARTSAA